MKYLQTIMQYPDVIKTANFSAERDSYDKFVRRFVWYKYNQEF